MSKFYDADMIRASIQILKPSDSVFEVRVIGKSKFGAKETYSGYFKDAEKLISALGNLEDMHQDVLLGKNVYVTLNEVDPSLYCRIQRDWFMKNVDTTGDKHIARYKYLFIDFDPVRASGISSSTAELEEAKIRALTVRGDLSELYGFPDPIIAFSGNGYHLLYRTNLTNNEHNQELIKRCLSVLSKKYSDDLIKIDEVNFNPSRICKLYGTLAQKGYNDTDRAHRMSGILKKGFMENVVADQLEMLAEEYEEE